MDSFKAAVTLFVIYFFAGAAALIISAEENSTVSLPCFIPDPGVTTHWYKWSSVNVHNPLLSVYQLVNVTQNSTSSYKLSNKNDSSALVIDNYSSENHSGYYYCKKEISDTKVLLSCPTLLTNPPGLETPFLVNPTNQTSYMFLPVVLLCTPPAAFLSPPFLSLSSLSIHWTKGNSSINTTTGSRYIMADRGNLYIKNSDLSDSGLYQCIATDTVHGIVYRSKVAQLNISDDLYYFLSMPSQFQVKPHNRTVLRGQSTQFECQSYGFPVEWSRPNRPSPSFISNTSILEFDSVNEEDSGWYRCSTGLGGVLQEDVYLTVIDQFNISLSVSSLYPSSGSILTVQCLTPASRSLTGRVNVTIQVGGVTYYNPTYQNGVFTEDVYVGYEEGQSVSVQCIGISEYGYCDEETLSVIINSSVPHRSISTTIIPTPASTASTVSPSSATTDPLPQSPTPSPTPTVRISTSPSSTTIMPGQQITLMCVIEVINTSLAVKHWTNAEHVTQTMQFGSIRMYMLTATVSEPGNYTCEAIATNFIHYRSVSQVSIVPLTVIVPRQEVSVNEGESVNLTCSFNYGQSLIVIWSTETVGLLTTVSNKVTPNGTLSMLMLSSVDVTDAGVYYCFAAITSNHNITASIRLTVNYLPPSSPPLDVKAEWMPSLRLLVISWSAPAGNDSSLLGYKLNWGLSSQYESLPKSARGAVPYTTQFFTIDNLVVKETYLISVWAYGLGGDGPSFNLKKFLPESQLPSPTSSSSIAPTATIPLATSTPSVKPSAFYELECIRITSLMGGVRFNNTQSRGIHHYSIQYNCMSVDDPGTIDIPAIANGLFVPLYNLSPEQCWVSVDAIAYTPDGDELSVLTESCSMEASSIDDHISVDMRWINGSVLKLSWSISSFLSSLETDAIVLEWRRRNASTIPFFSSSTWSSDPLLWSINEHEAEYVVDIRIKIGTNVIHTLVVTPPSPFSSDTLKPSLTTPTSTPQSSNQSTSYYANPWLTYGIGIAFLVFVCCLALLLVLLLKYVQTNRREIAKADNRRISNKSQAPPPSLSFHSYSDNKRPISIVSYDSLKKPFSAPSPPLSFASSASSNSTSCSEKKVISIRRIDTDV